MQGFWKDGQFILASTIEERANTRDAEMVALRTDAARYRLLRRGQHWSVIDGSGDELRAEILDATIDAHL